MPDFLSRRVLDRGNNCSSPTIALLLARNGGAIEDYITIAGNSRFPRKKSRIPDFQQDDILLYASEAL